MFYDLILFRQRQGKLGMAWLAATRGIRHVNKKEINQINIEDLCDEITNYVCSSSTSPRQRFSLRLSAILINGVVKIYHQQAIQFLSLVVESFTIIKVPNFMQMSIDETPAIPQIHRVKTKSRKPRRKDDAAQPVGTPLEDLLAKIQSQEVFTPEELDNIEKTMDKVQPTTAAAVTIVELAKPRIEEDDQFGVIDERELQVLLGEISSVPPPPPKSLPVPEPQILTQIEPQIPAITIQQPDESIQPIKPSNVITVVADVHAPAGEYLDVDTTVPPIEKILPAPSVSSQQQLQQHERVVEMETIREIPEEQQRGTLQEVVVEEQQPVSAPTRRPLKRPREPSEGRIETKETGEKSFDSKLHIRVQMKTKTTRTIDRTEKYELKHLQRYDICEIGLEIMKITPKILLDRYNLIAVLIPDEDFRDSKRVSKSKKPSSVIIPVEKAIEGQSSQCETLFQQEQQKTVDLREIPMEITQIHHPSIVEPIRESIVTPQLQVQLPNIGPQLESTPLTSKAQITPECVVGPSVGQTAVAEILPPEEPMEIDPVIISAPAQPVVADPAEIRRQNIIEKVLGAKGPLKIEEICPEPINRRNIVKTFYDLLVLCKAGYVALEGGEFCELKFIHKGRRVTTKQ